MGKALILPDSDFSSVGLGRATYNGEPELQAIWIVGPSVVIGERATYHAAYYPPTTQDTGVTWSIVSGNAYATMNSGLLTIDQSANNNTVIIAATSTVNNSIVGTKSVNVTYLQDNATLWDIALIDPDFSSIMANATKEYQLQSPITKDGTTVGTAITNPITSQSTSYVVLFDATFPAQINTDNPALFARLGIGASFVAIDYDYWYFIPKWLNDKGHNIGIPKGQNYNARILLYHNVSTHQVKVKNLINNQVYTYTTTTETGSAYSEFYLGGGASSPNNYNGTINEFIVGTL